MLPKNYQPTTPFEAIVFDCDGTLSHIEGIDELASHKGVGAEVSQLTADAMSRSGMSPELYQQRLNLVMPTAKQVTDLGETYFQHITPDLLPILQIFMELGKTIYIVSAGLELSVINFGKLLKIDSSNIFAVKIYFDAAGQYSDFDRSSPLVRVNGKRAIVSELKKRHEQLAYVGDGLNDYETHDLATRFIGYGGAFYRAHIEKLCEYYITTPSITPLLPMCLTAEEVLQLNAEQQIYYRQGLKKMAQ